MINAVTKPTAHQQARGRVDGRLLVRLAPLIQIKQTSRTVDCNHASSPTGTLGTINMEDIMRISNTMLATAFLGLLTTGTLTSVLAAPLPTNIAAMKSISSSDAVEVRWGGWRGGGWGGGWRGGGWRGGWGHRGFGGWGLGAAAAGAVVGGAIASGAYYGGYPYGYGGYPYYGDAYAYAPGCGYGGYYPYRRYGW